MARGRKPKTETEIEEVVEDVVEQPAEIIDDMGGVVDVAIKVVNDEIIEEPTPIGSEISSEPTADDVVDTLVEEKPKRQRKKKETKSETKDNETTEESEVEFNPDVPLPEDSLRTILKVKNFTTIYRDENLTYPYARVYGDVTLIDFVSPKVLKVRVMFNGRLVVGYIGRGSIN